MKFSQRIGKESVRQSLQIESIEKSHKIHGALKTAFSALYGYTSDSGGIRHSLLEDDIDVSMEEPNLCLCLVQHL